MTVKHEFDTVHAQLEETQRIFHIKTHYNRTTCRVPLYTVSVETVSPWRCPKNKVCYVLLFQRSGCRSWCSDYVTGWKNNKSWFNSLQRQEILLVSKVSTPVSVSISHIK